MKHVATDELTPASATIRRAPQRRRAERTVERILAVTDAIIAADGVGAVSTNRIARETGMSIGAIYQYFPNKEAIVIALYRQALDNAWSRMQASISGITPSKGYAEAATMIQQRVAGIDRTGNSPHIIALSVSGYPGIAEADLDHGMRVKQWLTDLMIEFGSPWPRDRIEALAAFIYAIHSGATWHAGELIDGVTPLLEQIRNRAIAYLVQQAGIPLQPDVYTLDIPAAAQG